MAVGDIYRLTVVTSLNGEPILNTFHYLETNTPGVGSDEGNLASAFDAAVAPSLANVQVNSQLWSQYIVQGVKPVKPVVTRTPTPTAGTIVTSWIPLQCAVILSRKTATPGKGGRGRLFIGAIPSTLLASGADEQVVPTLYNTLAGNVGLTISSAGFTFQPVLFKRKTLTFLPITLVSVNRFVKTRRSRAFGTRFHRRRKHTVGSI